MFCKNIITFFNLVIKYSYSLILYLEGSILKSV